MTVQRILGDKYTVPGIPEGKVQAKRKDGGLLNAVFCDVFVMKGGKIKYLTSYLMEVKQDSVHMAPNPAR